MPKDITVSALNAEYGAFYKQGSQNLQDLLTPIFYSGEFDKSFTPIQTDDTIVQKVLVNRSGEVLQAFQPRFTPKGGGTMLPFPVTLGHVKAEDELTPDEIDATFLGFMASKTDQERKNWTIVKWWGEEILMKGLAADLETYGYSAEYTAPTLGIAGAASASFDGFGKYIQNVVGAGHEQGIIATGALETTPEALVEQIEYFVSQLPVWVKNSTLQIMIDRNKIATYRAGMRAKYGSLVNMGAADASSLIDYPNITLDGKTSMADSDKICISPKSNLILFNKRNNQQLRFKDLDMYKIQMAHDHYRTYAFVDPNKFFHNDVENG